MSADLRRVLPLLAASLLALAAGCISDLPGSGPRGEERTLTVNGRERMYVIYVPAGATAPMPLVLSFHGFLGTARMQENYTQFNPVAAREKFIVVYPNGLNKRWSLYRRPAGAAADGKSGPDDIAFALAIVEDVAARHPVDRSRVFATGMSNGALFCYALAAEAGGVFAAIAPVAGGLTQRHAEMLAATTNRISLMVIQNDADRLVPYAGGTLRKARGIAPKPMTLLPTTDTVAFFARLNGCGAAPEETDLPDADPADGTTTRIMRYPPGPGGQRVELWTIRGGGHCWPGRPTYARGFIARRYIGKPSRDFDGAEAIWAFFENCPPR